MNLVRGGGVILDASGRPARAEAGPADPATRIMEVVRSFSYKLSIKNPDGSPTYESADFFCSHKTACTEETRQEVSADLDQFCMDEVLQSIRDFKERRARKHSASARSAA